MISTGKEHRTIKHKRYHVGNTYQCQGRSSKPTKQVNNLANKSNYWCGAMLYSTGTRPPRHEMLPRSYHKQLQWRCWTCWLFVHVERCHPEGRYIRTNMKAGWSLPACKYIKHPHLKHRLRSGRESSILSMKGNKPERPGIPPRNAEHLLPPRLEQGLSTYNPNSLL